MSTVTYRPNGAGTNTDITYQEPFSTSHYDKVDEESPDDSTTYVYTFNITYLVDTYNFANPSETGIIDSIAVYFRSKTIFAGNTGEAKAAIYVGSTLYYGSEENITSTWANFSNTWTTNPATSAAWTWSDLNSLEIGVALKSAANQGVCCTQVYVVITYHPSGGSYAVALGL